MTTRTDLGPELRGLLDKALDYADDACLAQLHGLLVCLSEGADLVDYSCDVPDGLQEKPVFKRMLLSRNLLNEVPRGCA
ncbi:MAG: hypothetical protein P4M00_07740 [Azospirillaceae bacterium]|nr:hypothetical protein [Azospirillaceae bacterium]